MKKTLYLEGGRQPRVQLEAHSIRARVPGQADRYFPLRRLSRIVAQEGVEFDTDVLLACASQGVPLVITGRDGRTLLRLIGTGGRTRDLMRRLEAFAQRPDWYTHFQTWQVANRRRIATTLVTRMRYPYRLASHPEGLTGYIGHLAERLAGPRAAELSARVMRELSIALIHQQLQELGLDARDESWQLDRIDLIEVLGELLALRIETIRLGWLRGRCKRPAGANRPLRRKELVHLFERNSGRIERLGHDIINRLHRWLVSTS